MNFRTQSLTTHSPPQKAHFPVSSKRSSFSVNMAPKAPQPRVHASPKITKIAQKTVFSAKSSNPRFPARFSRQRNAVGPIASWQQQADSSTPTLWNYQYVTVAGNPAQVDAQNNFSGSATLTPGTNVVPIVATDENGVSVTNKFQVVVPTKPTASPTYDLNGNLTNDGAGKTFTWDAKDELVGIGYASGASTAFTYDGLGRRVKIIEKNASGTVTSTKQHLWLGNTIAEERDANDAVQKRFFGQGVQIGSANYYYTLDHLGSIREMLNASGSIVARYDYDPFGRVNLVQGTNLADFQYAGMYEHGTSGLNLTRAGDGTSTGRPYDPNTAHFIGRDPLQDSEMTDGLNVYDYVKNDPINEIDPLGLFGLGGGERVKLPNKQPHPECPCGQHWQEGDVYANWTATTPSLGAAATVIGAGYAAEALAITGGAAGLLAVGSSLAVSFVISALISPGHCVPNK